MAKNNRSLSLRRKEEELADMEQKTQQIRDWIEGLLKEKLPKQPFREVLLDGVVLCKLANAIKRDCIKRFHKKPRMLMMKMENIAFFLTACKSRFNIPQAVIFAPTDIHDDSDPTSMRKVINVLLLMQQEMGGGPTAAEAAKELEEQELRRQKEYDELEAQDIAAGIITAPAPKPPKPAFVPSEPDEGGEGGGDDPLLSDDEAKGAGDEPEPVADDEPEPQPVEEPEPQPPAKPTPAPAKVEHPKEESKPAAKILHSAGHDSKSEAKTNGGASEFDYYLKGKPSSDHAQVQSKILAQIIEVVDSELSLESKVKLVAQVQAHINAVYQKVMLASTDELRSLAHEMGLGNLLSDVPTNKDRQWYVDFILKHGRAQ